MISKGMDGYDGPRANITEISDTISASVEETNRIRALLGLNPLREGLPQDRRPVIDASTQPKPKPSAVEVRKRIEGSRAKRTRKDLVSGPSLGEELADDEKISDSAAWVAQMRKRKPRISEQEKRNDRKTSVDEDEDKFHESDLKVVHQISEFDLKAGEEMILTLKDRRLIDEEGELDETEDLLENPDLAAKKKREKLKRERSKAVYNPFDEDAEDIIAIRGEQKSDVLKHYDEWAIEAKMVKRPKGADAIGAVRLGDITAPKPTVPASFGVSLTSQVGIQKDYKTLEEVEAARKKAVTKMKKGKKGKSGTRRVTEETEKEINIGEFLERKNPEIRKLFKEDDINYGVEDLDDIALYEQLARRRKIPVTDSKLIKEGQSVVNAVSLIKKLDEIKSEDEPMTGSFASNLQPVGLVDIKPEEVGSSLPSSSIALEFTSTTEFCRALETPLEKLQNLHDTETTKPPKRKLAQLSTAKASSWRNEDTTMEGTESLAAETYEGIESDEDDDLTPLEEQAVELLVSEDLSDGGIASALKMLKSRGELDDDKWRLGRHSGENRPLHQSTDPTDIRIEYKDEFGRVLSPKDAFRCLSWAFHGKGPGKKKREKLLKKIEMEKKKKATIGDASRLPTMQALRKQQKQGEAHVVLSSGSTNPSHR